MMLAGRQKKSDVVRKSNLGIKTCSVNAAYVKKSTLTYSIEFELKSNKSVMTKSRNIKIILTGIK